MMDTYKAYSSFAPVYTDAVDKLYDDFGVIDGRKLESVLRRVAQHCDSLGCTFVGYPRLMKLTGYSEGTVKRSLTTLGEIDYIRVHVEHLLARRKPIITVQMNPRVLWIQATVINEAESLWSRALKYCNVIRNDYPEPETESEPETETRTRNQNQNQPPPPPPREAKSSNTTDHSQRVAQSKKNQRVAQSDSQDESELAEMTSQRVAQSQNSQNTPPVSAAPPPLVGISRCRKALQDSELEDYAHWLQAKFGTRLQQARQVVLTYGLEAVKLVVRRYDIESQTTNFSSPFGITMYWLSRGEVLQADVEAFQISLQEHTTQPR